GEEEALFLCARYLCLQEFIESLGGHKGAVNDFLVQDLKAVEQNGFCAVSADQLDGQGVIAIDDDGLLIVAEVISVHGGNVGLGMLRPCANAVWVCLSIVLYSLWSTTVGVTFKQNRVNSRAFCYVVFILRIVILWQIKSSSLQFCDGLTQLNLRSRNIWKLNNICFRGLSQLTKLSQCVWNLGLRELSQDTSSQ